MSLTLWSVEGNQQRLDGGAMFGNVPRALWEKWMPADERHRIPLSCRGLLAKDLNGMNVLFETGIGAFFEPKLRDRYGVTQPGHVLLRSLQSRGLSHEQIDVVVLSHLHFDHAGGLLSAYREGSEPRLLFSKAKMIVSERAWQRAQNPHLRDRASFIAPLQELLESSGRLEIVYGETCRSLGDSVRFSVSHGHTPGLLLSEIGGTGGVVFCSDLIPGRPWVHLPVTMGYDRYPELLIEEKRDFLEEKMGRGVRLFFTHDPDCALARVGRNGKGAFITEHEMRSVEGLTLR